MKNCVLGISCFGHDTSASIVDGDSQVIFASAQEVFTANLMTTFHIYN